jgi:hypothetical protein
MASNASSAKREDFVKMLSMLNDEFMRDQERNCLEITIESTNKVSDALHALVAALSERERYAVAMTLITVAKQPNMSFENKSHYMNFLTTDALVSLSDSPEENLNSLSMPSPSPKNA